MPNFDSLFNAFVTILVTIDPPGLAPLFLAVTRGMNRQQRYQVSIRASVIGFGVLAVFALMGAAILAAFGITLPAFRVAGGLLLFFIAFEMVFERRNERKEKSADTAITKDHIHNVAAFPLAIPLIAGPGAISATVLLSGGMPTTAGQIALVAIILVCLLITYLVFVLAERIDSLLGETGRSILTRLLGVILAALAVQFVADGVKALMAI
ncbi:MarC family protein [Arvimicrobium flavum]|uniref:MarC family protein n=1 Tax=Arvimicrobium flavum TaxID=3393320 RepID=UPI00237B0A97|nr:MarC family protein [Mesorhizobium shangrilense]